MTVCDFCNTELSSISALNKHKRTSKYCIKIQEEKSDNVSDKQLFKCEHCDKELTSNYRLQSHLKICKTKKKENKDEMKEMMEKVLQLTKEVERMKEKPSTTTNNITITDNSNTQNNINNYGSILTSMTPEMIQETFKSFSIKDLLDTERQRHLANLTIEKFLSGKDKSLYFCKDRSRNKFVYTDEENSEKEDPNAAVLRKLVYNGVSPVLKKLYQDRYVILYNELARCLRNDDLATILGSRDDIKELEEAYKEMNILKNGDEYISQLSKCLPASLKDRVFQDNLELERKSQESDQELELFLKKQTRMIANYTIAELQRKYKDDYIKTGVLKGPIEIMSDPKNKSEYISFMNEK